MIYVASPYTHKKKKIMEERYRAVAAFCTDAIKKDFFVYSPIVHWHPVATMYDLPIDYYWWARMDKHFIGLSSRLWVLTLDGWQDSKGVREEVVFALKKKIKVTYIGKGGL